MVNPTFLQACAQAIRLWGHTTPTTRDANWKTLKNAWHESEGMAKLWRQIKTAVTFAVAAGQPIPPEQIVDAALICINRIQAYKQSYLSYKQLPVRNYTTLKTHFEQAERDRIEVEDEAVLTALSSQVIGFSTTNLGTGGQAGAGFVGAFPLGKMALGIAGTYTHSLAYSPVVGSRK